MRIADIKKLRSGDEVYWNDPDEGACSRMLSIHRIDREGNVVTIVEADGGLVECFARELSAGPPEKRNLWEDDKIQFARLLCELVANWDDDGSAKRTIRAVASSMDLEVSQVNELFDRADAVWEQSKAKHCR